MTSTAAAEASIQERYFAEVTCFGCGPRNAKGLRLRSYPVPGATDHSVRAAFAPWPEHDNGYGFLNGGIIATLLDCHGAAAIALTLADLGIVPDGTLHFVTAGIEVSYRRPAPLRDPVELRGQVVAADDSEITVATELWWEDKLRAAATAHWKRWRPRPGQQPPPPIH